MFQLLSPFPLATRHKLGVLAILGLAISPLFLNQITITRLTGALFIAMFVMSWDVVSGYTGEISFGHAFFFALGGYSTTLLGSHFGLHPLITIVAAVVVAAIGGLLIGIPALRVSGPYLSLITLIAPILLLQVFILYNGIFGGESGLQSPDSLVGTQDEAVVTIAPETSVEALAWGASDVVRVLEFYLALGLFLFIMAILLAVTRSNAGAVFYAIRSGEDVVAATGKNPAKFKIFVFVLSAAIGGLVGAVFVHSRGTPTPSALLELEVSLLIIIAAVIGSMGTITGAAIGGLFVHMVEKSLLEQMENSFFGIDISFVQDITGYQIADMSFMLLGVTALVIIYAAPGGLLRWGLSKGDRWRERLRNRGEKS
mgnify:CR=1 FL=1